MSRIWFGTQLRELFQNRETLPRQECCLKARSRTSTSCLAVITKALNGHNAYLFLCSTSPVLVGEPHWIQSQTSVSWVVFNIVASFKAIVSFHRIVIHIILRWTSSAYTRFNPHNHAKCIAVTTWEGKSVFREFIFSMWPISYACIFSQESFCSCKCYLCECNLQMFLYITCLCNYTST